jgi:predicted CopG family antitoxin
VGSLISAIRGLWQHKNKRQTSEVLWVAFWAPAGSDPIDLKMERERFLHL